ncbi:MAG: DUF4105 domain-containing protein [Gluconacetobacter diazotrophicus]|nr:DUF4105 domain-containing protein [Gluconacetobacter diazotrophicus]
MSVLVGEPFGSWGTVMPLGHTAIYLDHVCADGPLRVRMCRPGEPAGVVIARYHAMGKYDWMASPVREFLFATDDLAEVPAYATPDAVWAMRERFRERFLRAVVPDGTEGHEVGDGRAAGAGSVEEWWESAGAAYNRRLWAYQIATTPEQDETLIRYLNATPNRHLYHLKKTNCADFAAELVNVIYPHAVHNDRIADFGLMTPKEVARSLAAYAARHPELELHLWQIPQLPGSLPRSRPIRGGAESGLKTKRYLLPLLVLQPEVPAYLATIYLWHGRWFVGTGATALPLHTLPPADRPAPPGMELAGVGLGAAPTAAGAADGEAPAGAGDALEATTPSRVPAVAAVPPALH